jgi:ABC-type multidrug transport system fused ATPase/permease subunit
MESEVMKSIDSFNKELTIFIVAHRITTLNRCNKIIKLDKNGGFTVVNYFELQNGH